jgi:Tol biopolymer transport system component
LDYQPAFSGDGSVAFVSDRSGNSELWRCGHEGNDCVAITSFNGPEVEHPQWSPDGKQVAFEIAKGKIHAIMLIGVQGAIPRQLTDGASNDVHPSWSRDGKSLYFGSDRSGSYQIWKASVDSGKALQVTHDGGFEALESADGHLYYTRRDISGVWRSSTNGASETKVLDQGEEGRWAMSDHGIYLLLQRLSPSLVFFNFSNRRWSTIVAPSSLMTRESLVNLTVSPDNKWGAFTEKRSTISIMLVKNFQ